MDENRLLCFYYTINFGKMQVFGRTKKGAIEIATSLDFMIVRAPRPVHMGKSHLFSKSMFHNFEW